MFNAAARVVSGTNKFDRGLSRLLHTELHWLDVPERVAYKLSVMMYSCMHGQAPQYLMDFLRPTSSVASRQQLPSAGRQLLSRARDTLSGPEIVSLGPEINKNCVYGPYGPP